MPGFVLYCAEADSCGPVIRFGPNGATFDTPPGLWLALHSKCGPIVLLPQGVHAEGSLAYLAGILCGPPLFLLAALRAVPCDYAINGSPRCTRPFCPICYPESYLP